MRFGSKRGCLRRVWNSAFSPQKYEPYLAPKTAPLKPKDGLNGPPAQAFLKLVARLYRLKNCIALPASDLLYAFRQFCFCCCALFGAATHRLFAPVNDSIHREYPDDSIWISIKPNLSCSKGKSLRSNATDTLRLLLEQKRSQFNRKNLIVFRGKLLFGGDRKGYLRCCHRQRIM